MGRVDRQMGRAGGRVLTGSRDPDQGELSLRGTSLPADAVLEALSRPLVAGDGDLPRAVLTRDKFSARELAENWRSPALPPCRCATRGHARLRPHTHKGQPHQQWSK